MFEIVQNDNESLAEEREILIDELRTSMNGIKELRGQMRINEEEFFNLDNNVRRNFEQF